MASLEENATTRLASINGVDLSGAETALYVVPSGKSCIITSILLHQASTSLATASVSIGYNSATFDDVVSNGTHTELATSLLYKVVPAKSGAAIGTGGSSLYIKPNTTQAATVTVEVFGYLF